MWVVRMYSTTSDQIHGRQLAALNIVFGTSRVTAQFLLGGKVMNSDLVRRLRLPCQFYLGTSSNQTRAMRARVATQ
ncbi:hypothetical protein VTK56DRAFT_5276 [Thermocarpiscus australiensis]